VAIRKGLPAAEGKNGNVARNMQKCGDITLNSRIIDKLAEYF
jgi:hypothetical protein